MKLYYYCSYTESPVGYILGKLHYTPDRVQNYALNSEDIPPLIRKCFESGMIRKAAGFLPSESACFLLMKKLTAKNGEGNAALNYYLNLALETEDPEEFADWLRAEDAASAQELADAIKSTIEIDRSNDFGFTVRGSELKSLVQKSFHSLFPDIKPNERTICFEVSSTQTGPSQLKALTGFSDAEFVRVPGTERWFRCNRKKKRSLFPFAALLSIAAVIAAVLFLMERS